MTNQLNAMKTDENDVERDDTQINGRTAGPFGSDDADTDLRQQDNKHNYEQENSANGLDSQQVRGGQDGRNNRGIGSTDMDSKNGVLRIGDQDDTAMQVPDEAMADAARSDGKTNTGMADVTTSGPDDYGSAGQIGVPKAQEEARQQNDTDEKTPADDDAGEENEHGDDLAQTGTDLTNKPTY